MAIAGILVTPVDRDSEAVVVERLRQLEGAEVQEIGPKGVAAVLEANSTEKLKELSRAIKKWEEVADFQLAYLNWEDLSDEDQ